MRETEDLRQEAEQTASPAGWSSPETACTETASAEAPPGAAVRAESWTWQHPDRSSPAVEELSLDIRPGEKVLITGASGSGKSTLLHGLAGVLPAEGASTSGRLLIDGAEPAEVRGRAGLMQQDPEAAVVLSRVGDDVAFAPENLAVPREEIPDRVREALQAVGLEHLPLEHPTAQLSGGQKQRLALAGILAMRPGLLLLDEPTANLDPDGALQVRDAVLSAAEATGATLLVVEHRTHRWAAAMDRVISLDAGQAGSGAGLGSADQRSPDPHSPDRFLAVLPDWSPPSHTGLSPTGETLLRAEELAVHRHPPTTTWRSRQPPAPVLSGVELSIRGGEAVAITGPNGVGKSTLLLTLAGLIPRHGGRLEPDPEAMTSQELIRHSGMVFQEPEHQFLRATVAEELEHRQDLLERLRLSHVAQANPFTLSGGEKRRLSVGTALASGAQILLLDEPTTGQDAAAFADLVTLLRDHLDTGGAVIAVTHDQDLLTALRARRLEVTSCSPTASSQEQPSAESPETASSPELPGFGAVRSTSWLGRRGPLGKLIALVLITLALVASIDLVSAAVVVMGCFALLPLAGIRPLALMRRIWPFAVGALLAVWGTAIAGEESGRVLVDFGFTTVSTGSVMLGLALGLRGFAMVLPSVIILSTTDPTDLADSLAQQLKLPARFVLGALAAMRLMGMLAQQWTTLGHARRARGLGKGRGFGSRLASTLSQIFGLLVQAIRTATRLAVTMESRGFDGGPRSWARPAQFTAADLLVVLGGAVLAAAATAAAMAAGTWSLVW